MIDWWVVRNVNCVDFLGKIELFQAMDCGIDAGW
jgi:hypothetical protein